MSWAFGQNFDDSGGGLLGLLLMAWTEFEVDSVVCQLKS